MLMRLNAGYTLSYKTSLKLFVAQKLMFAFYRAFHGFGQAKFPNGGSVLGSSQFKILHQLPLKMMLGSKVVKMNSKISNTLC